MHGFGESHSSFVLELIADVLSVCCSYILDELLPWGVHLVCSCLVSLVKDVVVECLAKSTLWCLAGTSVALASSTTTPTPFTFATATVAIASPTSSAHNGREEKCLLAYWCYNQPSWVLSTLWSILLALVPAFVTNGLLGSWLLSTNVVSSCQSLWWSYWCNTVFL